MKNEETDFSGPAGLSFISTFCILPSSFPDYGRTDH